MEMRDPAQLPENQVRLRKRSPEEVAALLVPQCIMLLAGMRDVDRLAVFESF